MALTRRRNRSDTIGSLGDMEYLASSGLWVPVSGGHTTGYVPTVQGDGTIAWAASGGGTLPAWVTAHPDTPPASPTLFSGVSYDKEFASLGAHGGTVIGSPSTAPSIVNGLLKVMGGTSTSADLKGVEWAGPSGNFTMTVKTIRKAFGATFWVGGPFLRANASGSGNIELAYTVATGSSFVTGCSLGSGRYSALTTRTSISTEFSWPLFVPVYQRLVYNGTSVIHQASYSGHPDSFVTFVTDSLATALGGTAPGRFGFGIDSFSASFVGEIYCQFIRFT